MGSGCALPAVAASRIALGQAALIAHPLNDLAARFDHPSKSAAPDPNVGDLVQLAQEKKDMLLAATEAPPAGAAVPL